MVVPANPDEPVIVDAAYDRDKTPDVKDLAQHPPLKRPEIGADKKVRLMTATAHEMKGEKPADLHPANLDEPPFCFAGRLNVHWSSADKDVHGSAQFVAPRLLLTAAHCVRWSGQWNRNLYFLRRYRSGTSDIPIFKVDKIGVLAGWVDQTDSDEPSEAAWRYDFAVLRVSEADDSDHAELAPMSDDVQAMTSLGYPANVDQGQTMFYSEGSRTAGQYDGTIGLHPSHMGFGASGGAWFAVRDGSVTLVGLNSFKMSSDPKTDYSPILSDSVMALLRRIAALG